MSETTVTITVRLRAKPAMAAQLKEAGLALIAPTRAESGCISYHFHEDTKQLGLFLFYEVWQNRAALEKHLDTPYLKSFRKVLDDTLAEPAELIFWQSCEP